MKKELVDLLSARSSLFDKKNPIETAEAQCLIFFYSVYTQKTLPQILGQTGIDYLPTQSDMECIYNYARESYFHDPMFHASYQLNFQLVKQALDERKIIIMETLR